MGLFSTVGLACSAYADCGSDMQKLAQDWFAYNAVVSRLDYKSEEKSGT